MRVGWLIVAAAVGCGSQGATDGEFGGHCFPNGTCNVGLNCIQGTCGPIDASVVDAPEVSFPDAPADATPDALALVCHDDSQFEPNDTIGTAYDDNIGTATPLVEGDFAICPAGDKDTFKITITTANQNIELLINYTAGYPPLAGAILNSGGVSIANAVTMSAHVLRAFAANLPTGTYYAQILGPSNATNNYSITITTSGP